MQLQSWQTNKRQRNVLCHSIKTAHLLGKCTELPVHAGRRKAVAVATLQRAAAGAADLAAGPWPR